MPKSFLRLFLLLIVIAFTFNAEAKGKGKDKWKDHKHKEHSDEKYRDHDYYDRHNNSRHIIRDNDRVVIREYLVEDYNISCPPGLAKKHNGCLPPGIARKRYAIGHRLPDNVVYVPVSPILLTRLEPAPIGYQYVRVDRDILLISEASKKVIDAVTLLSAVGN